MIDFTIETTIDRPPSEVFTYATDPTKLPSWQTNTVSAVTVETGPIGPGTHLREVHRGPGGKQLESLVEVSEYEPDRVFGLRMVEGQLPIHGRITLEPNGGGTLMGFRVYGELEGPMRIAQPILRLALKRQFKAHCMKLKEVLESR